MSGHEGVSCNHCLKVNFTGKRYKCLRCFDYDLCSVCYAANVSGDGHTSKDPMQCILSSSDYALYYGGESITNMNVPQSLTCPYCGEMGYTDITLKEHISDKHYGVSTQVICPICASSSNGDPNFMVTNMSIHLTMEHSVENRRRLTFNVQDQLRPHVVNIAGAVRPRANIQVVPAVRTIRANTPIVGRDAIVAALTARSSDPIDELLMQISRIRRIHNENIPPLDRRVRCTTSQVLRTEVNGNSQLVGRQNLYVQPSTAETHTPEVIHPEPPPYVSGYAALLPNIINDNSSPAADEVYEARADFVKELFHSVTFCKPDNDENKKPDN